MSKQEYRLRLQRLIFMIRHGQVQTSTQTGRLLSCDPCTVKRMIERLRLEGYEIHFDRALMRYVLKEED